MDNQAHIFLDTETTGVWANARMVSVAIQLDLGGEPYSRAHWLIRPTFEIPAAATAIHGITTQVANDFGLSLKSVLETIERFFEEAPEAKLVGHNLDYDRRVLAYDATQAGQSLSWPQSNFCTMRALSQFVFASKKLPKLEEAYHWMFGEAPPGLHSARADMIACREIFYEGVSRGLWHL